MADITLQQRIAYYLAKARHDMDLRGITVPDGDTILLLTEAAREENDPLSTTAAAEAIRILMSE